MANNMLRLTYDGDGCGRKVGRAIIANDEKGLHNISAKIDLGSEIVNHWVSEHGGKKISGGGDEGSFTLPEESAKKIEELREKYYESTGITISVGIGKDLSEAGRSLLSAKFRGKDQTVWYDQDVEKDIENAREKIKEGKATQEEYKLGEAYLEKAESMKKICELHKKEHSKDHTCKLSKSEEGNHAPHTDKNSDDPCPYCADNENNRTDDCQYCQDLDAQENADGTAGMDDCQACKDYDSSKQNTGGIDDCPYCQTENITAEQANPSEFPNNSENHECNCPNCPQKDQSDLAVEDMGAEHPENCPQCQELYSGAVENQPDQTGQEDPNLQGHETAEEVLNLLDQEPGTGSETPSQAAKQIDNTEMPQGDQTKDNVSVKDNFGDKQKNDISDSDKEFAEQGSDQDQPDMASVLQSGLDDHANEQKRQQVLNMVGQTLAGFKANKAALEASKEENQGLYNSCIQMLKSMIELCKLLGLEPKMPESQPQENQPDQLQQSQSSPKPQQSPQKSPSEGPSDPKAEG